MAKIEFDEWLINEIVSDLLIAGDSLRGNADAWVRIVRAINALRQSGVKVTEGERG